MSNINWFPGLLYCQFFTLTYLSHRQQLNAQAVSILPSITWNPDLFLFFFPWYFRLLLGSTSILVSITLLTVYWHFIFISLILPDTSYTIPISVLLYTLVYTPWRIYVSCDHRESRTEQGAHANAYLWLQLLGYINSELCRESLHIYNNQQ